MDYNTTGNEQEVAEKLVKELAQARIAEVEVSQELTVQRSIFEERHADLIAATVDAKQRVEELERQLRELTRDYYITTGERSPHPALGIREMHGMDYDEDAAIAWAIEHRLPACLTLNRKLFERAVSSGLVDDLEVHVDNNRKVTPTIATNLEKWLD